jgi:signal transduction histidine kinase
MRINSLATRFLAISIVWSTIALVVTAILLTTLYKNNAQKNFQELLTAHLYNLMGVVDRNDNGTLTGRPNLGDPRFQQPFSGWYWSVLPLEKTQGSSNRRLAIRSNSLGGENLNTPDTIAMPFKDGFLRTFQMVGIQGEEITVAETQIFLGEGDNLYRFMVAGNNDALELETSEFTQNLVIFLALFGVGMVISTFVIIKYGLRPLNRAKDALNEIRNGEAERLEGTFPDEITPLITEMNALIDANKTVLERARTQVGNLAHALKTPISVLKNEARSPANDLAAKVGEQTEKMQEHVQRYLDRARIATQVGSINARTPITPVLDRMLRVMQRLNPHLQYDLSIDDAADISFRGEQQDLEEVLGNLVENASIYAVEKIKISVQRAPRSNEIQTEMLELIVEDDGPGLSKEQRSEALKRGRRLDETKPGSGLGLSIVNDIVQEYKGTIELGESQLGGLMARVFLPLTNR